LFPLKRNQTGVDNKYVCHQTLYLVLGNECMTDLIILGAGGFGLEVAAYAEDMTRAGRADFNIKGFLDDTKAISTRHAGYPILGKIGPVFDSSASYILAVGMPEGRKLLANKLRAAGARVATVIHPESHVAVSATFGTGTIIAPFAFAGPESRMGEHCLINTHACVGHESRMDNFCVLSPHVSLQGGARLGMEVFVGSHACIGRVTIGDKARIAAGSVVYNDVPPGAFALGNPAAFKPT
jgi:acetyltransferase EpsM